MRALAIWKAVATDEADLLGTFVRLLEDGHVRYCVIGGQAVNAYVEPLVSLDLDVAVAADQLEALERRLPGEFRIERFPHSLNISHPDSQLRIQIRTAPRYAGFVERGREQVVLGMRMRVAAIEDVLQGKVWAASDATRQSSKRQKDLADIARLLESRPDLRHRVPADLLARLA